MSYRSVQKFDNMVHIMNIMNMSRNKMGITIFLMIIVKGLKIHT